MPTRDQVKIVTQKYMRLHISATVEGKRMMINDNLYDTINCWSNCHVTDDVTTDPNVEILRLMLLLETNIGCKQEI